MKQKMNYLLLLGIIMIATNLRAPITSVGPLVGTITNSLNLTGAQAGLITTLPLIAFAIISPIAPKLARKFGTETTILGALILIILGLSIRYLPSISTLFLGTAILGCGIAIGNVLIPSIVKQEFQNQSGLVTGTYSVSMNLTGAIASGVSIPLIEKLGWTWNQAFSLWIILAALALLAWLPQLKNKKATPEVNLVDTNNSIWHSSLAWSVSLFMGIQSFIFYVLVAWLPEMLISQGIPSSKSGGMLSLLQLTLLPTTFIIPIIAEKRPNQKSLVVISFTLFTLGISGLMFSSLAVISLSIIAIGIAGGIAFSLSMMFFNLRTSTPKEAADLSGMAQSIGYILAAVGPFLFGLLHDLTNNWQSSLFLLIGITIILLFVGLNAGSSKKV
ncbi:CynX/NimT family MFS transporter [Vagococcus fluvialis]|uniref:CynX/NimT family MFS transporter n=1 Tax=Vagococcus fluvialis TaxID=2738 RepID=UPI003D1096BA